MKFLSPILSATAAVVFLCSCGGEAPTETPAPEPAAEPDKPEPVAAEPEKTPAPDPTPSFWTNVKIHDEIRKTNPDYTGNGQFGIDPQGQPRQIVLADCGIKDISFLKGMPLLQIVDLQKNPISDLKPLSGLKGLQNLYLENTAVKDFSALEGMKLDELYLTGTPVTDLSPLQKMAVNKLNLVSTPVTDLKPLAGVAIGSLWLTDAPVSDISGLEKVSGLVSVTLHRTKVEDLSPLVGGTYPQGLRLHIGETPVKDLAPLGKVPLTRLVFTPGNIKSGLDEVRKIPMLREIGTQFDDGGNDLLPPTAFWPKFDADKKTDASEKSGETK